MKVVIVEDEKPAADKLERMLVRYDATIEILQKLRSIEETVHWLDTHEPPDLLFLDIHLLDGTCFEILKETTIPCPVIFTTAYDQYALEAFQLQSIDYLLKPIRNEKLEHALQKFQHLRQSFQQHNQAEQFSQLLNAVEQKAETYKSRFLVKSGSRIFSFSTQSIAYFLSEDKITFLTTFDGKKYSIPQTLDELEQLLDPQDFFRINRQMIVHIGSIEVVHTYFKGRLKIDLQPSSGIDAVVSSRRATEFKEWLDQ